MRGYGFVTHVSSYVRQGDGRPSTGSTGATVSIFLGRDSEARELRAELGGHSFRALTGRGHNVLRESSGLRHFQSRRRRMW